MPDELSKLHNTQNYLTLHWSIFVVVGIFQDPLNAIQLKDTGMQFSLDQNHTSTDEAAETAGSHKYNR